MTRTERHRMERAADPLGFVVRAALYLLALVAFLCFAGAVTGCVRHCEVPLAIEVYTPPRLPPAGVAPVTLKCKTDIIATAPALIRE